MLNCKVQLTNMAVNSGALKPFKLQIKSEINDHLGQYIFTAISILNLCV